MEVAFPEKNKKEAIFKDTEVTKIDNKCFFFLSRVNTILTKRIKKIRKNKFARNPPKPIEETIVFYFNFCFI